MSPGRARVALFRGLGTLLESLPLTLDTLVASQLSVALGRTTAHGRGHLRDNLRHALAGRDGVVDEVLLERYVDRAFHSYGQYWAEGAKLPALTPKEIEQGFVIAEGQEYLMAAKAKGAGVIVALPHIGSWEWGGAYLARIGLPMTAVAEELEPPELFEWFRAKREAIGLRIEPLNESAGTVLLSTLREGGVVGLLCDRDIQHNGIEVEFFGETVTMPAGPATLAIRTGATIVPAACYIGPGEGHHAVVAPPIDTTRTGPLRQDVQRITQRIAVALEGLIRRAPEQWHVLEQRFPA